MMSWRSLEQSWPKELLTQVRERILLDNKYCEIKANISLNFRWLAVSMHSYRHEWHVIEYIIKDTNKNSFIAV